MLHHVDQRLLKDAEQQQLDLRREAHGRVGTLDAHVEDRRIAIFLGDGLHRGDGAEIVEHRRPQQMRHLPY